MDYFPVQEDAESRIREHHEGIVRDALSAIGIIADDLATIAYPDGGYAVRITIGDEVWAVVDDGDASDGSWWAGKQVLPGADYPVHEGPDPHHVLRSMLGTARTRRA